MVLLENPYSKKVMRKEFEKHFQELITRYRSGPEEYFVIGAKAYLSTILNIRSFDVSIECLSNSKQDGGMPLSLAIYERL